MREAVAFDIETQWNGTTWVGRNVFKDANGWPVDKELVPPDVRTRLLAEYQGRKKDAGGTFITKAESGKGGAVPPLPPEQRPFDPFTRRPLPPRAQDLEKAEFNPFRGFHDRAFPVKEEAK